jgi:Spy/CpxP family protein refolding chaperone
MTRKMTRLLLLATLLLGCMAASASASRTAACTAPEEASVPFCGDSVSAQGARGHNGDFTY